MGKKFKGKRPQSLTEFLKSPSDPSSMPPPSPSSTVGTTPRNNGYISSSPREIWANSPRSIMTPPSRSTRTRDDMGRLIISQEERHKRSLPPVSFPLPIPRQSMSNFNNGRAANLMRESCFPGTEISRIGDKETRYRLTKKIEDFVDWMAIQHVHNGSWLGKENLFEFDEILCTKRQTGSLCNRGTNCKLLPDHENHKAFIPQLYHLLQDYDLFLIHMNIVNNDETDADMKLLQESVDDWIINIGEKMGKYNPRDRVIRYREMMTQIRRVEFLRTFDVNCCQNKERNHIQMDKLLKRLYGVIERKVDRLEKNYTHLS